MWIYLRSIKRSLIAFVVVATLGLLSMGFLGIGLYYRVFFALPSSYPNLNDARGDWVWPATIAVGMAWSIGFLFAGSIDRRLHAMQTRASLRPLVYLAVLWLWALLLWWFVFAAQ